MRAKERARMTRKEMMMRVSWMRRRGLMMRKMDQTETNLIPVNQKMYQSISMLVPVLFLFITG